MADVKPIRTDAEYEAALAEVARLWGAKLGTPNGDRLDSVATLIDAYEAERFPIDPPDRIKFRSQSRSSPSSRRE